ncbi:MAG: pilus assembly protein PilP [Candidatus Tectomicrobia bacterium]|nr:pilus assembly protein PilP [Candidatus Tectomicrobia bacterium]
MRWFAMIATSVYVVASMHGGLTDAASIIEISLGDSVTAPVRAGVSPETLSWQMVAQQEVTPQTPEAGTPVEVNTPLDDTSPETYRYRPDGRRDPFESLVKEKPPEGPLDPVIGDRPREPLERFDISTLKLVGILWGQLGRRALIRAPDNKGYFVTVGTYMGEKGGQVIGIDDDRLMIEEKYKDTEGNIVGKTLDLPLRRKEKQER